VAERPAPAWARGQAELAEALTRAGYTNVRDLLPVLAEHDHPADFEFGWSC